MSFKKLLTHALCYSLLAISLPAVAMKQAPTRKLNYATDTVSVFLPGMINGGALKEVKTVVEIIVPDKAKTDAQRLSCFAARAQETKAKLTTVMQAYLAAMRNQTELELLKIVPTDFYYNPDKNSFIVRQNWGTHQLTDECTALLETRVSCSYDAASKTLKPMPFTLHIFPKGRTPLSIAMDALRALYPHEDALNIVPAKRKEIDMESLRLAMEETLNLIERQANVTLGQLPDPYAHTDKLYLEDVKKMAAYYVTHHTPNNK